MSIVPGRPFKARVLRAGHPGLRWVSRAILCLVLLTVATASAWGQRAPGELAWAIRYDPKTLDPAKVDDQVSELVRYLTAGVLVRVNRQTQVVEPALAAAFDVSADGRVVRFKLRAGLRFSDGSGLTSKDVAWSLRRVLAAETGAPVAEEFVAATGVKVETPDAATVRVLLPKRVVGIEKVFDEIAIEPADRPSAGKVTAGPFVVAEAKPGQYLRLVRNAHYWRTGLPKATGIRLDVVTNREQEMARFGRGEYDLIDGLTPDYFGLMAGKNPKAVRDMGASLNTEQMWFNQAPGAPLPDYEKAWFGLTAFRVAVSEAIQRADLARIAYDGHATVAVGFISPANTGWYNAALDVPRGEAAKTLAGAGFTKRAGTLYDAGGHAVKFSILTNAGNAARMKMATLIQQDLGGLGMQVNLVTLDFPALIERLMHTQNYEACLLGHPHTDPDPSSVMNEWLSSSPNHQWNPSQKTPATPWEAEIDKLMTAQAGALDHAARKKMVDRVQQIVAEQQPFIYLVHPNTLYAVSPQLRGVVPLIYSPGLVWNVEMLQR